MFQNILGVSSFVFCCNRVLLTAQMSNVCVKCTESCEAEDLLTHISFASCFDNRVTSAETQWSFGRDADWNFFIKQDATNDQTTYFNVIL